MTLFNDDYDDYISEPMYSTKKIRIPYEEALLKRNSVVESTPPPHELTPAESDFPFTRIRARLGTPTLLNQYQELVDISDMLEDTL